MCFINSLKTIFSLIHSTMLRMLNRRKRKSERKIKSYLAKWNQCALNVFQYDFQLSHQWIIYIFFLPWYNVWYPSRSLSLSRRLKLSENSFNACEVDKRCYRYSTLFFMLRASYQCTHTFAKSFLSNA